MDQTKERVEGTRATVIDIIGRTGNDQLLFKDQEEASHKLKFNWLDNKEH